MTVRAVHWHEGMFLRPHHFQAAERFTHQIAARAHKWDLHYNWGLRAVDLDLDALANYRLVVRELKARLRDGTLISVPEDNSLPALDLKSAFEQASGGITVYDTKGKHVWEDAVIKIKAVAAIYRMFLFVIARKVDGRWTEKTVAP